MDNNNSARKCRDFPALASPSSPGTSAPKPPVLRRLLHGLLLTATGCLAAGCATGLEQQAGSGTGDIMTLPLPALQAEPQGTLEDAPATPEFLLLPEDIRSYLDREIVPLPSEDQRYTALRQWAFEDFRKDYEYDPTYTAPIAKLEDASSINCFSFSNLFVAAARYADVSANFQLVESPPEWDINNKTWIVSQHINVTGSVYRELSQEEKRAIRFQQQSTGTLIRRNPPKRMRRTYVVDLNPEIAVDAYRSKVISDAAAEALFHSNRSVEELLGGNREQAMEHARLAIAADNRSPTAWNNIGVLMSRQGRVDEAKQAYQTALALDPKGESAANNLERIYRRTGEVEKADAMVREIRSNRQKNPYYHYALGESLMAAGDAESAIEHFENAIERKEDERLFYYALVEAQIETGAYKQASKNLQDAKKHSSGRDMQRYNMLNSRLSSVAREG